MLSRFTRWLPVLLAASALLLAGGAAWAARGQRVAHSHRGTAPGLAQQCVAAKAAGSASAVALCAAANDAANPPLTPAQLSRMQTLGQQCLAEKAVASSDRNACAEADALAGG